MTVASHLGIQLADYDAKIRTFIPNYDQMLDAAADALHALDTTAPHVVDLGTGTGALAERCLRAIPDARVTAIDEDAGIVALARQRLQLDAHRAATLLGSFLDVEIPQGDAIVGSLTFHHLRTDEIKRAAYRRFRAALSPGGLLVSADCNPSTDERLAAHERAAWRAHLGLTYSDAETDALFASWANEDVYVPLGRELELLDEAGFHAEVAWRLGAFAVIAARRG
jgi:SAM-dependent methyltransferase